MQVAVSNLTRRMLSHDQSKLNSPEKEIFDDFTPKLEKSTYGSDEYKQFLSDMKPALDHHYAANSHHPEHYGQRWECPTCKKVYSQSDVPEIGYPESEYRWCGICHSGQYPGFFETALVEKRGHIASMTLLDLLEMLCDWKAATLRHNDGCLRRSIEMNQQRFGYTDEMKSILFRTATELGLFEIEKW